MLIDSDAHNSQLVELISESIEIKTQEEFLAWTQNALQKALPHEVMISAWGNISLGIIYYEIISTIPGASTNLVQRKNDMDGCIKRFYSYWMANGRTSSQLLGNHSVIRCRDIQDTQLKSSMQNMKSALIHAIKDSRGGSDSIYVLLSSNINIAHHEKRVFPQLLPCIDATLRQIGCLTGYTQRAKKEPSDIIADAALMTIEGDAKLSDRESEIIEWVCRGKTNIEIGLILDISSFTVKNHLQNIFKKINVVNRSQAVAKTRGQIFLSD